MTLEEIITSPPKTGTIYVATAVDDATPSTTAIVFENRHMKTKAVEAGFKWNYFLEIELLTAIAGQWSYVRNRQNPSGKELVEAVIWYAQYDAYIPL
jgi:hypothetical protein